MGVMATKMMAVMEGSLAELATAVSARFEIPQRDVLHLLRSEFRKVRAATAKTFRDMATDLPPVVNSELPDIDQEARFRFRSFHSSFELGARPS